LYLSDCHNGWTLRTPIWLEQHWPLPSVTGTSLA
jgi:hypothetical protein